MTQIFIDCGEETFEPQQREMFEAIIGGTGIRSREVITFEEFSAIAIKRAKRLNISRICIFIQ